MAIKRKGGPVPTNEERRALGRKRLDTWVTNEEFERLKAYADREYEGKVSLAIRALIASITLFAS